MPEFTTLTPEQVLVKRDENPSIKLVDVRTLPEYEDSHIPGCLHLPLHEIAALAVEQLGVDDEIIVYCRHGVRSKQAASYLAAKGYVNVSHMSGGLAHWIGPLEPE